MAVTGLTPSHDYEFRVYAENVYGRSDPATSNIVQTKDAGKKKIPKKKYEGLCFPFLFRSLSKKNIKTKITDLL